MSREVLSFGREDYVPREPLRLPWELRRDRGTRSLAVAIGALLVAGGSAARSFEPPPQPSVVRAATAPTGRGATLRATASVAADGAVLVTPAAHPTRHAARRAAELVAAQQCRRIERPRYRRVGPAADADDGRTATFVIAAGAETPRRAAGFVLRLAWREGEYVGQVSGAYGGCASG